MVSVPLPLWLLAVSEANLMAARYQMAISLGFHIILAALGIGFPLITLIAHTRGLRRKDPNALLLAKRWSKVMAVLFAVGAVSGTILSFEMGMLWPGLMGPFGDVIGVPFTLEGVSFFLEAIFLAIYLYGWKHLSARVHYLTLFPIVLAGIFGSFFIVSVNGWMNSPAGFAITADGTITNVDPWAAMFNPAALVQYVHMLLAAYMVSGFLVAGVYATGWLKGGPRPLAPDRLRHPVCGRGIGCSPSGAGRGPRHRPSHRCPACQIRGDGVAPGDHGGSPADTGGGSSRW